MRAYLGLGSNLGDRLGFLLGGLEGLAALGEGIEVSPVYETAPVGGPESQGPYLNVVARLETALSPHQLLGAARRLEEQAGRVRDVRFGPRTLDVDLLLLDDLTLDEPELTVPHPRMIERAFVLAPLEDLAPELVPAGWREQLGGEHTVEEMARRVLVLQPVAGARPAWRPVDA